MRSPIKRNLTAHFVSIIFLFSACQSSMPAFPPSIEFAPLVSTPSETSSPIISPNVRPTETDTPIPIPSATSTPELTFSLFTMERNGSGYNLGFIVPGITMNYRLVADGKNFFCSIDINVPDRIYCFGPDLPNDYYFLIQFFDLVSGEIVYEAEAIIPSAIYIATMPAGDQSTWCPLRGQNVTCESETVWSRQPIPCYASTCYDACGYYYSIDTCIPGT